MPTPTKGHRFGGSPAHERHMMANLATALFEHGRITTTEARARKLRPLAERLITFAKRGDLHARRQAVATLGSAQHRKFGPDVVHTLFEEIGPSYASRDGGYTRITKIGPRKGDNAPLAVIELVTEEVQPKTRRRRVRRPGAAARAARDRAAVTDTQPAADDTAQAETAEADTAQAETAEAEIAEADTAEAEADTAEAEADPAEADTADAEADGDE